MRHPSDSPAVTGGPSLGLEVPHQGVPQATDIVCFSHLRWNFVFQRPQHLLTRAARQRRVFYVEEPVFGPGQPRLELPSPPSGVQVVVPHLPEGRSADEDRRALRSLVDQLLATAGLTEFVAWYYTPMALEFTDHLLPAFTVYDCMDELTGFKGAPAALGRLEAALFARADVVFTGGRSLYRAKRRKHGNVHAFPSSIDKAHFERTVDELVQPADQALIPAPRLGFCGVIDERMDTSLLEEIADLRPDWQYVMIGPVVKIDPESLPQRANIHYLGGRSYEHLPAYLAGWDAAIMPFALNDATRFISPTKTLEYLAAGLPVVSTAIADVVDPYGELGLVGIARSAEEFVRLCEELPQRSATGQWRRKVATVLAATSWDSTWARMEELLGAPRPRVGRPAAWAAADV